jgi:hypothetical protein
LLHHKYFQQPQSGSHSTHSNRTSGNFNYNQN